MTDKENRSIRPRRNCRDNCNDLETSPDFRHLSVTDINVNDSGTHMPKKTRKREAPGNEKVRETASETLPASDSSQLPLNDDTTLHSKRKKATSFPRHGGKVEDKTKSAVCSGKSTTNISPLFSSSNSSVTEERSSRYFKPKPTHSGSTVEISASCQDSTDVKRSLRRQRGKETTFNYLESGSDEELVSQSIKKPRKTLKHAKENKKSDSEVSKIEDNSVKMGKGRAEEPRENTGTKKRTAAASSIKKVGPRGMEIKQRSEKQKKGSVRKEAEVNNGDSSSESEWEDVSNSQTREDRFHDDDVKAVDIVVEKKNKKDALMELVKQHLRQARRRRQVNLHKVYLLCFVSAGMHRNKCCSSDELQALLLSVTPSKFTETTAVDWNNVKLSSFTQYFLKTYKCDFKKGHYQVSDTKVTVEKLITVFKNGQSHYYEEIVMIFVALLRALGLQCRLVWNSGVYPDLKRNAGVVPDVAMKKEDHLETGCDVESPRDGGTITASSGDGIQTNQSNSAADDIRQMLMSNENFQQKPPIASCSSSSDADTPASSKHNSSVNKKKIAVEVTTKVNNEKKVSPVVRGIDMWVEVFIENCRWCSVSLEGTNGLINKPYVLEKHATSSVAYVFAFDNENCLKDVTKRYAIRWGNFNRKLRVDWQDKSSVNWLSDLVFNYKSSNQIMDAQDDANIADQMNNLPLPQSIAEAKHHALYVIERHLLKFEVLYPKDAPVLGYIKKEPVFSRIYVKLCHTEQNWLKEGMAIKAGEIPMKFVRPMITVQKLRRLGIKMSEVPLVGIFGDWQIERYQAPPVEDGRIPRNSYGNVELFKLWMLPAGSVYVPDLPGLDLVAKDLDVDCVPAMRGWDFPNGYQARPVIEGFVVCAENEELLREVWKARQTEATANAREARAIINWKRLVKALRISEMIKRKYEYSHTLNAATDKDYEEM